MNSNLFILNRRNGIALISTGKSAIQEVFVAVPVTGVSKGKGCVTQPVFTPPFNLRGCSVELATTQRAFPIWDFKIKHRCGGGGFFAIMFEVIHNTLYYIDNTRRAEVILPHTCVFSDHLLFSYTVRWSCFYVESPFLCALWRLPSVFIKLNECWSWWEISLAVVFFVLLGVRFLRDEQEQRSDLQQGAQEARRTLLKLSDDRKCLG